MLLGGDFNFISNPKLDRTGGASINPSKKREHILKLLEDIKEYAQLKDIWRTRNPDTKRFTWRRVNPVIKSRLDYWFISENTEDSINETDIVPFNRTDHSAIVLKLSGLPDQKKGRGIWRLNTSFLNEEPYIKSMLEHKELWIEEFKNIHDLRVKWELIKYRIRQLSMKYGREKAKKMKKTESELEEKIKQIEKEQDEAVGKEEVEMEAKKCELQFKLDEITEYKTQGLIIRSQAEWYEKGEKSTKYFLQPAARNRVKKSIRCLQRPDGTLTTHEKEIRDMQAEFYKKLYSQKCTKTYEEMKNYLKNIEVPKLSQNEMEEGEGLLTLEECRATLKTFKANKTPGNDGLPI